jgi:hypothetical protein
MDYIFASMLKHYPELLRFITSYDICCQWSKNLSERLLELPPYLRNIINPQALSDMLFVIPKMHLFSHRRYCQRMFSFNLTPGTGDTDGEGVERTHSAMNPAGSATALMGPGCRQDHMDDQWGFWNWMKLVGMGMCSAGLQPSVCMLMACSRSITEEEAAQSHPGEEETKHSARAVLIQAGAVYRGLEGKNFGMGG